MIEESERERIGKCPGCGCQVDKPGVCEECFKDGVYRGFWDSKKEHVFTDKEIIKLAESEIESLRDQLKKRDSEIQQLKQALKEIIPLAEIGVGYESQSFYNKYNPIIDNARKLL